MPLSYYAARANLYFLWQQHPTWSHAELAAALACSTSWVAKWLKRFGDELAAGQRLDQVLPGHSRARKTPPPTTHPLVVELILSLRDQPPEGLRRVPGQEAIRYYLERDPFLQFFQLPLPSCKTIYRVLKSHERIAQRSMRVQQPVERPAPMTCWQIDFKDVSSVPAEPEGKRQHVVETLNIIDTGTSVLLDAHVRSDFTAETALQALALTLAKYGCPKRITLDRDPRLQWAAQRAVIFRRLWCALEPVWGLRSSSASRITPSRTALSNATTALIKRNASRWIGLPTWSKPKPRPRPSWSTTTCSGLIKDSPVAIALHGRPFHSFPLYPRCPRPWILMAGSPSSTASIWSGIRGWARHGEH